MHLHNLPGITLLVCLDPHLIGYADSRFIKLCVSTTKHVLILYEPIMKIYKQDRTAVEIRNQVS